MLNIYRCKGINGGSHENSGSSWGCKNNGRWEIWTALFPLLDRRGEERVSELRKWRMCTWKECLD